MKNYIYILIFVGFLVFGNALSNGFVWDDEELILTNVQVHSLANWPEFFKGSTFNSGGGANLAGLYYKPMMTVAFSLVYSVFGPNAFFFHLLQISLHIVNAVLVFLILKYLFRNAELSFLAAILFLVHPQNVETAVYLADYQEVLFFFFAALAWWKIINTKIVSIWITSGLFLLSILSKETGFVFIFIIGVYCLFFDRKNIRKYLISVGISFGIYAFLRFGVAHIFFNKHGLTPMSVVSLPERLVNIPKIIFSYLSTFIWPANLTINQQWIVTKLSLVDFWWPLSVVIIFFSTIVLVGIYVFNKHLKIFSLFLFFMVWFLAGLALHLQIMPLDLTVSDRWFYLPMVGLISLIIILVKLVKFDQFAKYIFLIIILFLALRSFVRTFDWRDGYTLYSHDIKNAPEAFDLQNNLGVELFRRGEIEEAKKHFIISTELSPKWWTSWNNLGAIVEREGNYNLAREYYQKSIDYGHYYLAYENMAKLLTFRINREEGIKFTREALKYFPNNVTLLQLLGSN